MPNKLKDCPYCGKAGSDFKSYDQRYDHVKRRCPMLPAEPIRPPVFEVPPPAAEEPACAPPAESMAPGGQPAPETGDPRDVIEQIIKGVTADVMSKLEARLNHIEHELGGQVAAAVENIEAQVQNIPALVETTAVKVLRPVLNKAGIQPDAGEAGADPAGSTALSVPVAPGTPGSQAGLGMLNNMISRIDFEAVLASFVDQYAGGDLNAAIAKMLINVAGPKKKSGRSGLNAMMLSRGQSHMASALRNKKIDSEYLARSEVILADEILADPEIPVDVKSYYTGRKSEGMAWLASIKLAEGNALEKAPAANIQPAEPKANS